MAPGSNREFDVFNVGIACNEITGKALCMLSPPVGDQFSLHQIGSKCPEIYNLWSLDRVSNAKKNTSRPLLAIMPTKITDIHYQRSSSAFGARCVLSPLHRIFDISSRKALHPLISVRVVESFTTFTKNNSSQGLSG